jgi:hypothetical protein
VIHYLRVGQTVRFNAPDSSGGCSKSPPAYNSSNVGVATIGDGSGVVTITAVGPGSCIVTIAVANGASEARLVVVQP